MVLLNSTMTSAVAVAKTGTLGALPDIDVCSIRPAVLLEKRRF